MMRQVQSALLHNTDDATNCAQTVTRKSWHTQTCVWCSQTKSGPIFSLVAELYTYVPWATPSDCHSAGGDWTYYGEIWCNVFYSGRSLMVIATEGPPLPKDKCQEVTGWNIQRGTLLMIRLLLPICPAMNSLAHPFINWSSLILT